MTARATQTTLPGLVAPKPTKAARPRAKRRPKPTITDAAPYSYEHDTDEQGRRCWVLTIPAPDRMLSVNQRLHYRARHALAESWRGALSVHAKAAKLPVGVGRVRIDVLLRFVDSRSDRDALNYYPFVVKPAVDGLGPEFFQVIKKGQRAGQTSHQPGHGLIVDDTPAHLDGPFIEIGPKADDRRLCPFGQVVVTITDLSEVTA